MSGVDYKALPAMTFSLIFYRVIFGYLFYFINSVYFLSNEKNWLFMLYNDPVLPMFCQHT